MRKPKRIGIDFDNTIACYDGVFHRAAVEKHLIEPDVPIDKTNVRDELRRLGRNDDFTKLQGYVYGARMDLVSLYPGALDILARARAAGYELFIISHKTRTPFAGPPYDLHSAALEFLAAQAVIGSARAPLSGDSVFFEPTKEAKVARIAELRCNVFIDDLPELLAMEGFPGNARLVLFDPEGHYRSETNGVNRFERYESWREIGDALMVS